MLNTLKRVLRDTWKVFSTRWSPSDLNVPAWVVNAVIYITALRSFSYGMELFILGNSLLTGPLSAFTAILGIQIWGLLMIIAVVVLIIGLVIRNTMLVTIGSLLCVAVWAAFFLIMGIGWADVGYGGRHVVAAFSTAATWGIFFYLQLRSLRINGVRT